jgi:hypothetical protein
MPGNVVGDGRFLEALTTPGTRKEFPRPREKAGDPAMPVEILNR